MKDNLSIIILVHLLKLVLKLLIPLEDELDTLYNLDLDKLIDLYQIAGFSYNYWDDGIFRFVTWY